MSHRIYIDTASTCSAGAVGRKTRKTWTEMGNDLGWQVGPVVYAVAYDDDGPIERLVIEGSKRDRDVASEIRAFVAEFPGIDIDDRTMITR